MPLKSLFNKPKTLHLDPIAFEDLRFFYDKAIQAASDYFDWHYDGVVYHFDVESTGEMFRQIDALPQ